MGKYSLESYEQYQTLVIRPRALPAAPDNRACGQVNFASSDEARGDLSRTVIRLNGTERIGGMCDKSPLGLLIPPGRLDMLEEVSARGSCLALLHAQDTDSLCRADALGLPAAMLLDLSQGTRLDTAQHLAHKGLGDRWRRQPVFAEIQGDVSEALREDLLRWHVCAANANLGLGCDLRLRRVTCPARISGGGALPLRLWFDNRGSAPLYGKVSLVIRLSASGQAHDIVLDNPPAVFQKLGDCVYNEILRLPMMPPGTYGLSLALMTAAGEPFHLNIDADSSEGFYVLGQVDVDDRPRPEMFSIWDHYYPEGYYPLEDPAQPLAQ